MVNEHDNSAPPPRVRAPEFKGVSAWLNTDRPLTIAGLRGQVVLFDFWTYCCINCMHVLPDLAYLEARFADEPVVIVGVHSGKFDQEKETSNIRQALLRHDIVHPIAVDSDFETWNAYAIRAWPTLMVIDPEGYVVGFVSGEGHRAKLERLIAKLLDEHREKGTLRQPLHFTRERDESETVLRFPGKLLADGQRQKLLISDSGRHRVLIADLDGRVRQTIGRGEPGRADGGSDEASFLRPQGLALSADGRTLYIADCDNHLIRAADLDAKTVTTIAGTGSISYDRQASGPALETGLNSPWDVALVGDVLFIAMAGLHQIWRLELATGQISAYAGTGVEAATDGRNAAAAFAQPSGLATDGQTLYVADSEVSSIRAIDLEKQRTTTLAGAAALFHFGHEDGPVRRARFQHPLGVALHRETLFVADTFSNAIRAIDLHKQEVATFFGDRPAAGDIPDSPGDDDAPADASVPPTPTRLYEPADVAVAAGELYVADTNHHRIVAVNLDTKSPRVVAFRLQ